jgi:hypothetical protein
LTEATSRQKAPASHPDRIPVLVWVIAAGFVALLLDFDRFLLEYDSA